MIFKDENIDIFIITSVLNTGINPWSYTNTRSYFTVDERFNQTIDTIKSIRNLNDNSKIILAECSFIDTIMENKLKNLVDLYINLNLNTECYNACINSYKKGYGETKVLEYIANYIIENDFKFKRLFKISGRYILDNNFNKLSYSLNKYTFKLIKDEEDNICQASTVLYSIPYNLLNDYKNSNNKVNNLYESSQLPIGLENVLYKYCSDITNIDILGICGNVAVDNSFYKS